MMVPSFSMSPTGPTSSDLPLLTLLSVLAGSEDKVAYLYDLRMGTILHRVRGTHGDAVTDVAFNPLHPQLATATLDGNVHFYSDVA